MSTDKTAIRDAATVVVVRDRDTRPSVLMGQRGERAAFMPNKFVFPGGAVDPEDAMVPMAKPLNPACEARLAEDWVTPPRPVSALAAAAIRELWEETGQILAQAATWSDPPTDWLAFARINVQPDASKLRFFFRAITPPGRTRRFDARFFLVDAAELSSDLDDFSQASEELSNLQWVPLEDARKLDMPFITQVVLGEVWAYAQSRKLPESVPFFRNDDEENLFLRLNGRMPQE